MNNQRLETEHFNTMAIKPSFIRFALAIVLASVGTITQAAMNPKTELDHCNVVWDSPSTNSSGSMPLGNGDIGVNAWVEENGDLVFFISKTDAWSDCGRLLKLGQVRLPPSLTARPTTPLWKGNCATAK